MKISTEYFDEAEREIIEVTAAIYKGNFVIEAGFSDGTSQLVDFKPFLKKSFHPSIKKYLKEELFRKFKIKNGNLNWNDFDLIFPLHDIYTGSISLS